MRARGSLTTRGPAKLPPGPGAGASPLRVSSRRLALQGPMARALRRRWPAGALAPARWWPAGARPPAARQPDALVAAGYTPGLWSRACVSGSAGIIVRVVPELWLPACGSLHPAALVTTACTCTPARFAFNLDSTCSLWQVLPVVRSRGARSSLPTEHRDIKVPARATIQGIRGLADIIISPRLLSR